MHFVLDPGALASWAPARGIYFFRHVATYGFIWFLFIRFPLSLVLPLPSDSEHRPSFLLRACCRASTTFHSLLSIWPPNAFTYDAAQGQTGSLMKGLPST
jgi:hypothetical protein